MISVIIPAYNAADYIGQALESLQEQTYKDIEIIVVDDGSTDHTREIVQRTPQIRYHFQENQGEAAARNKGMALACGDFFAFLDADDWYEPTKLEKQYQYLVNQPKRDIVYCDFITKDEFSGEQAILRAENFYPDRRDFLATILFRQILPNIACTLFRRHCFDSGCRFKPALTYAPDYDFSLQLLQEFNIGYIPEPLYGYRRHRGNITNAHHKQRAAEIQIVQTLGHRKIEEIIQNTTFSKEEKQLLLAKIFLKIAEYSKALTLIEPLLNEASDPLLYLYAGSSHYLKGTPEKSIYFFSKALELRKDFVEAQNNLGCAFYTTGERRAGTDLFHQALKLRPGYMDPLHNLADCNNLKITIFELRKVLTNYY